MTYQDLFDFVSRADSEERVKIAEEWLRNNSHVTCRSVLDRLLGILEDTSKRLFREKLENDERVIAILCKDNKLYYTEKCSGEVLAVY